MIISEKIDIIRETVSDWKRQGLTVGFVPTMGNLHEGHLTLVKEAQQQADRVVVSIFVNPMQFNNADDLTSYPRTLDDDSRALMGLNVDLLFCPTPEIMYPNGLASQTQVTVPHIGEILEGALRPGHFTGVSTVVNMLFNIVQPDVACFGEKDYQQLALIRAMVKDLCLPVKIIGVPTVREKSGLARSSRNNLLVPEHKAQAPQLYQAMQKIAAKLSQSSVKELIEQASQQLEQQGFQVDSIDICDANTLSPMSKQTTEVVILMAAFLGKVRLIDNCVVNLQA